MKSIKLLCIISHVTESGIGLLPSDGDLQKCISLDGIYTTPFIPNDSLCFTSVTEVCQRIKISHLCA